MKKYIEVCSCGVDVTNNMSQNCFACGISLVQHPPIKRLNNMRKMDKALVTMKTALPGSKRRHKAHNEFLDAFSEMYPYTGK